MFLSEFWAFLKIRKKFWLLPVLILTAAFGMLVVVAESSGVAPLIYAIF